MPLATASPRELREQGFTVAAAPRARWEYHTETLKVDLVADRLAVLGDVGWELVQVFAHAPTHRELWLKRRR